MANHAVNISHLVGQTYLASVIYHPSLPYQRMPSPSGSALGLIVVFMANISFSVVLYTYTVAHG